MRTTKNSSRRTAKKNNTLFIAALVLLFILVILIFFLVNKDKILTNLKETDFFGRIFGSTPELIENHEIKSADKEIPLKEDEDLVIDLKEVKKEPVVQETDEPKIENNAIKEVEKTDAVNKTEQKEVVKKEEIKNEKKEKSTTQMELYFVLIDGDGSVIRKSVKRTVEKDDSPLTMAINLLLAGPDKGNKAESKFMSLIPEGSKLLSAKVTNGVAYLNFNDMFEFNQFGVEGSIHQLEQVVYTATAFPTVDKVQFLIEGKQREYLGSEGQWIGSPLSRADF